MTLGFPGGTSGKEPACQLRWEDPLKEGKATHSSILAWRIPWTEEPGRPQSIESQSDTTEQLSKQVTLNLKKKKKIYIY